MALAACMSTPKAVSLGKGFAGKQLQSVTTRMAKLAVAPVAQPLLVEAGQKGGKLKTCKAAAKRFRITGTGKVMRRRPMKGHMLEKKSATHKHALERNQSLHPAEYNNVMGQLPGKGIKKPGNQKKALVEA